MKRKYFNVLAGLLTIVCFNVYAAANKVDDQVKLMVQQYLKDNAQMEHISAISVNVSPGIGVSQNFYAGSSTRETKTQDVNADSLFQIGSITKSFTAAVILKLEEEGKLNIDDKVGKFLPKYKQWSNVTIRQLLDMTGGLSSYSDTTTFTKAVSDDLQTHFTPDDLIKISYGKKLIPGFYYSNTNYLIASMVASKVSGKSFVILVNQLIKDADLHNTYYVESVYPKSITKRMVSGYYYNLTDDYLNRLVYFGKGDPNCVLGKETKDIKCGDMSWAGAAGGIVSNPTDVSQWARKLFTENVPGKSKGVLNAKSLKELKSFVSVPKGVHLDHIDKNNLKGYGLGIGASYDPVFGTYYRYQGTTIGYRVLYSYFPQDINIPDGKGLIITIALNSQAVSCLNHIQDLTEKIYLAYNKKTGRSNNKSNINHPAF